MSCRRQELKQKPLYANMSLSCNLFSSLFSLSVFVNTFPSPISSSSSSSSPFPWLFGCLFIKPFTLMLFQLATPFSLKLPFFFSLIANSPTSRPFHVHKKFIQLTTSQNLQKESQVGCQEKQSTVSFSDEISISIPVVDGCHGYPLSKRSPCHPCYGMQHCRRYLACVDELHPQGS